MSSQGPNYGSTGAQLGGFGTWTLFGGTAFSNPFNMAGAFNSGNAGGGFATCQPSTDTAPIFARDFGFSVSGTVQGVLMQIYGNCDFSSSSKNAVMTNVQLGVNGGMSNFVATGTNQGKSQTVGNRLSTTSSYQNPQLTVGGSSDLWGSSITAAQVNDAYFGAAAAFRVSAGVETVSVAAMQMTVYFTASSTQQMLTLLGCGAAFLAGFLGGMPLLAQTRRVRADRLALGAALSGGRP